MSSDKFSQRVFIIAEVEAIRRQDMGYMRGRSWLIHLLRREDDKLRFNIQVRMKFFPPSLFPWFISISLL